MADETSYGWAGKILRVNLSTGSITTQPTDPYKEYIGGMGLANKIMYDEVPAGTDPFSPENKLIFAVGPLTASGVPLAGRTTICSLSTFTKDHLVVDAHCGGMIGAKIKLAGWDAVAQGGSVLAETLISTVVIIFVAEYLPKSIVKGNPNFYYRAFAPLLFVFYILLYPIVWLTTVVSYVILRLFGCRMKRQAPAADFNRTDLESLIEGSTEVQHDEENEIKLFQNALDFADLRVRDCMVPRIDVEAVELSTSVEELTRRFVESKYSRIFVWEGSIDNIVGYVNSKSLFRQPADLRKVLMTAYFVPETMPLQALLEHFIKHRSYIAVVIDEFGGTAGIISLEDVLEQIFGEIEDEHDEQDMIEKQVDENEYVFSCRLEVKYLNERYGLGIEESREYDTLAGYIISHLDGIPSAGQSLTVDGLEIRVLRTTRSRIELARVRRL